MVQYFHSNFTFRFVRFVSSFFVSYETKKRNYCIFQTNETNREERLVGPAAANVQKVLERAEVPEAEDCEHTKPSTVERGGTLQVALRYSICSSRDNQGKVVISRLTL